MIKGEYPISSAVFKCYFILFQFLRLKVIITRLHKYLQGDTIKIRDFTVLISLLCCSILIQTSTSNSGTMLNLFCHM